MASLMPSPGGKDKSTMTLRLAESDLGTEFKGDKVRLLPRKGFDVNGPKTAPFFNSDTK